MVRNTVAQATAQMHQRVSRAYPLLKLPDNSSPELRRMAELTLVSVCLVLRLKMERAEALRRTAT